MNPFLFIILYNNEIYNGITGIAELAWVTNALLTETCFNINISQAVSDAKSTSLKMIFSPADSKFSIYQLMMAQYRVPLLLLSQ
jgi:hypothetical protein